MSRRRRFTQALLSGYALLGANVVYTLASVPLALYYLSREEFGLWALVTQITGYLMLIDLGMAGSIARILIDHKDRPADGTYGDIIKTGTLVLAVQGAIVVLVGAVLSLWLAGMFGVPMNHRREFQILVAGQCAIMGALLVGRMPGHVLQAHQRYDGMNYAQIGSLAANFGVMWLGLAWGWKLYSLLAAYAVGLLVSSILTLAAAARLRVFPPIGAWGRASWRTFQELFSYGREIFLLSVGMQLVSASQILVISHTLGLEAAAIWSIATKPFTLAQQVVYRVLDSSAAGLAEMMVRQERQRLLARFRDVVILTASFGVWSGLAVALCNHSFLALWTKGRITWNISNDWLMGLLVMVSATTRCGVGFIGLTKQIRAMKYIYVVEGLAFVGLSLLAVRIWGMSGIIASALLTNVLCSGAYGFWRTKHYFGMGEGEGMFGWLRWSLACLLSLAAAFGLLAWLAGDWNIVVRLSVEAAVALLVGFILFWHLGLSPQLRLEAAGLLGRLRGYLRGSE